MSEGVAESTPLINNGTNVKSSYKKTYHIYGTSLSILFIFALLINWYRAFLPTALTEAQAIEKDDFAGLHAYEEYLTRFTEPHSVNTRENGAVRDWLGEVVTGFQKEAVDLGLKMDVITHDPSVDVFGYVSFSGVTAEQWYVKSRNVIVRLNGTSGKDDAVLINAHFDSVPTSNGVTDDGMGVVTILESIRYFIKNPPRHTIIFMMNNFEEGGLLGARSFMNHPWYPNVKLFLNLEGAGAGGRATLFRCSNFNAVKKLANSAAGFKHGNALGNDVFKYQIIKSDTDYSVFVADGVPGLDIAFYAPRSLYHTPRDNLESTTPEALQFMGQVALHALKEIANSDDLLDTQKEQEYFVYYDILGRFMFSYTFKTYQLVNVLALLLVPVIASRYKTQHLEQKVRLTLQGLIAVLSALVFSAFFMGLATVLITHINPSMSYGDVYGAALYVFVAGFLGLQVSQLILPIKIRRTLAETDGAWYGLVTFWWLFVVLSIYTGLLKIAGLYFAVYLLAFTSLALWAHVTIPKNQKTRSAYIYLLQITIPSVMLFELLFLCMDTLRYTTADGTPEALVYVFLGFPLALVLLHLVPWVHAAGNNRRMTVVSAVAFLFLLTICSALQPFNGSWSPNKILFKQQYTAGDALATVTVSTATGLRPILKNTLSPKEHASLECEPFKTYLTRCQYQTEWVPLYGNTTDEFSLSEIVTDCDEKGCRASGSYSAQHSLMCRLDFDRPTFDGHILGRDMISSNISAMVSYVDHFGQQVDFSFGYTPPLKVQFSCLYDEWTKSEIPAFSNLKDRLPENAILLIRGLGLAYVNYKEITL